METTPTFIIDPELRDLLPGVPKHTDEQLEQSLIRYGRARDAITVWKETNTLLDGHRRYGICKRLGLPFRIEYESHPDKESAKFWMRTYQGSRRNMTPQQEAENIAACVQYLMTVQGLKISKAVTQAAEEAGVTERSVYRALSYSEALGSLEADIRESVTTGGAKGSKSSVIALAALSAIHQRAVVATVVNGTFDTLHDAMHGVGGVEEDEEDDPLLDEESGESIEDEQDEPESEYITDSRSVDAGSTGKSGPSTTSAPKSPDAGTLFSKLLEHVRKSVVLLDEINHLARNDKARREVCDSLEVANQDILKWRKGAGR